MFCLLWRTVNFSHLRTKNQPFLEIKNTQLTNRLWCISPEIHLSSQLGHVYFTFIISLIFMISAKIDEMVLLQSQSLNLANKNIKIQIFHSSHLSFLNQQIDFNTKHSKLLSEIFLYLKMLYHCNSKCLWTIKSNQFWIF